LEPRPRDGSAPWLVVALELPLPELQRLVVVSKPLKPAVVPEPFLELKLGLVVNHVEVLKLVVAQKLVVLGFVVTQAPSVLL
jgi:hypothetical protein